MKRVQLFDMDFVSDFSYNKVIDELLSNNLNSNHGWPLLITPNVDQVVKMYRPENFKLTSQLRQARWILPDGQPIVWLSRIIHGKMGLESRLTGSDFFPQIWKALKTNSKSVFFILPEASLGEKFKAEYSNIEYFSPPYFKLSDNIQKESVFTQSLNAILKTKPDFLFIGLGFPKQEELACYILDKLSEQGINLPVTMLLGASFEFYFGTKKRAPEVFQKLGLEFLHRMISEPGRMVKRYLIDDAAFFPLALREIKKRRKQIKGIN